MMRQGERGREKGRKSQKKMADVREEERKEDERSNIEERRGERKRGVRQRDSRLERCPNPSWLTDASATHLLPYCPAKLPLASYQGCRLEGRERREQEKKTEIQRMMETKGT